MVGWGFSFLSLESLKPAISLLKTLVVGLGGSLGEKGLQLLPAFCPFLEKLVIYFQVILLFGMILMSILPGITILF